MRHAARVDNNQTEIIDALRKCGMSVEYIKKPFDLLVWNPHKRETSFVECKSIRPTSEGGSNGLTKAQVEFIARWPGPIHVVHSGDEAKIAVLGQEAMA